MINQSNKRRRLNEVFLHHLTALSPQYNRRFLQTDYNGLFCSPCGIVPLVNGPRGLRSINGEVGKLRGTRKIATGIEATVSRIPMGRSVAWINKDMHSEFSG